MNANEVRKNTTPALSEHFPAADSAAYKAALAKEQKGKMGWEQLVNEPFAGISVPPLFAPENLPALPVNFTAPTRQPSLRIRLNGPQSDELGKSILFSDVEQVELSLNESPNLSDGQLRLFTNIGKATPILTAPPHLLIQKEVRFEALTAIPNALDPFSMSLTNGGWEEKWGTDYAEVSRFNPVSVVAVAPTLHESCDDPVMQLGWLLSVAQWVKANVPEPTANPHEFTFGLGSHLFANTAALRALRAGLEGIFGAGMFHIVALPPRFLLLNAKEENNLIRNSLYQLSALMGAPDAVVVQGHLAHLGAISPDELRLAANHIHLLREECRLDVVADPVRGSYYFENLTAQLLAAATTFANEVEAEGGPVEFIRANRLQRRVFQWQQTTRAQLVTGQRKVVGLNRFAWVTPTPADLTAQAARLDAEPFAPLAPFTLQELYVPGA